MAFNPTATVFNYNGGRRTVTYTIDSSVTKWSVRKATPTSDYNVEITSSSSTNCTLSITANTNTTTVEKDYTFNLSYTINDATKRMVSYTIIVKANPNMMVIQPICDDVYYADSNTSVLEYTIDVDNEPIYAARAYAEPNGYVNFNINKICANYLSNGLPNNFKEGIQINNDYIKEFKLRSLNQLNAMEDIGRYVFYNSYDYDNVLQGPNLNFPIRYKREEVLINDSPNTLNVITVDRRQFGIASCITRIKTANDGIEIEAARMDNGNIVLVDSIDSYYETNDGLASQAISMFRNVSTDYVLVTNKGDYSLLFDGEETGDRLEDYTLFKIEDTCYDYCLYYCNAYGGWDSLLIKGNVSKTDNINSQYYTKTYNNRLPQFEKKKYVNLITTKYTLYTDWFNDAEQNRLYHLLESTEVYLHNLNTDKIEPVNIKNSDCKYKTFTNNGRKKFYNTIEVEVAQTKLRK